jgi:hypothetical protein
MIEATAQRIAFVIRTTAIGAGLGAAGGAVIGILWGLLFGLLHGAWWESLTAAVGLPLLCAAYFGAGGGLAGTLTGGWYGMIDGGSATGSPPRHEDGAPDYAVPEKRLAIRPDAGPEGLRGEETTPAEARSDRLVLRAEVFDGR